VLLLLSPLLLLLHMCFMLYLLLMASAASYLWAECQAVSCCSQNKKHLQKCNDRAKRRRLAPAAGIMHKQQHRQQQQQQEQEEKVYNMDYVQEPSSTYGPVNKEDAAADYVRMSSEEAAAAAAAAASPEVVVLLSCDDTVSLQYAILAGR
jgi:hypothetical protein